MSIFNLIPRPRIISTSVNEAGVGQTFTVTVTQSAPFWKLFSIPSDINPDFTIIRFQGPGTTFINAITNRISTSVINASPFLTRTKIRQWIYGVTVPQGARTGHLQLVRGTVLNETTNSFNVLTGGISIGNGAQYNIVSILVDAIERLAPQTLPASSGANISIADISATSGNHSVTVVFGISANQKVMSETSPSIPSQNPFFEQLIDRFTMAQFLAFPVGSASFGFGSWQGVIIDANGFPVVHGFDFTFNSTTRTATYIFWNNNDRANIVSSGTVHEPSSWPNNAASVSFQLVKSNGQLDFTVNMDMVASSFPGPVGVTCVRQP